MRISDWSSDVCSSDLHGSFAESRFGQLGKKQWTLLVQAVDHYVPDVAALIEPFRFVPNWRIDDVMVSYAADESGVGPHFAQYRSEEHTSEIHSLMRISYAAFCLT